MITGTGSSFTRHSMREVVHGDSPDWILGAHRHDSTADRYFGERQVNVRYFARVFGAMLRFLHFARNASVASSMVIRAVLGSSAGGASWTAARHDLARSRAAATARADSNSH
jgi:hypothetical protein